jgi:hypothetical protein
LERVALVAQRFLPTIRWERLAWLAAIRRSERCLRRVVATVLAEAEAPTVRRESERPIPAVLVATEEQRQQLSVPESPHTREVGAARTVLSRRESARQAGFLLHTLAH